MSNADPEPDPERPFLCSSMRIQIRNRNNATGVR
jgi:hypothetical protein